MHNMRGCLYAAQRRYTRYAFAALFFLIIFSSSVHAQPAYSLVHYDETLLPQTSIGNIQQDKYGYLWMNTQYGIVRFDGKEFKTFLTNNTKGLSSNRIRLCAADDTGAVYFVDENVVFLKVLSPNSFQVTPDQELVRDFVFPLWSSTSCNNILLLHLRNKSAYRQFENALGIDRRRETLKSYATGPEQGYFFYADSANRVKLCYYDGGRYRIEPISGSNSARNTFLLNNRVFLQPDASSAMWLREGKERQNIVVIGLPSSLNPLFAQENNMLFSNGSGTFLYVKGQLYEYQWHDGSINATLLFQNLPCSGVTNVLRERTTGDIFISTKSSGVYRVKRGQFSVVSFTHGKEKADNNATDITDNNIVYALSFWNKNQIFSGGYLTSLTDNTTVPVAPIANSQFNVLFLYSKDSSHLWMDNNNRLFSFNTHTFSYQKLADAYHPQKAIALGGDSTLLITYHEVSLLTGNRLQRIAGNDSLLFNTMEKAPGNRLLLGTTKGLYYFTLSTRVWQRIPHSEGLNVRYIFTDRQGRMWITTYGQGLYFLSGSSLTPIPLDNGGYLSIAHSIAEDNSGNFWIPTNHGLFRIQYSSLLSVVRHQSNRLYYTYFDKTDGFGTNEFNGGCTPAYLYQKETGRLFFPSMNGVVTFDPDSIKTVTNNSPVVFDEMVVNDSVHIAPGSLSSVLKSNTTSLLIPFSSPYFGHDANIKFSYSLSPQPNEWKDLGNSRSIGFSNLPGGAYTLLLKKEEAAGAPVISTLRFEIEKTFTETLLFKILLLLGVIAVVYLFFTARLLYLNRERRRLEKEVAARTADQQILIGKLNGNIETLTQLQNELSAMIAHKENIIAVLIHDIKSPLHFLNTVAAYLNKTIDTNPTEKNREIIHEIAGSLNQLYLFAQDYTMWLNITSERIMRKEKVSLRKVTDEVTNIYHEAAAKKGIDLQMSIDADTVLADEPMLKSVVRNLVDNAIKHTSNGSIQIATSLCDDCFEIQVADEGKGMTAEQVEELNGYFASESDGLSFSSGQFGHKIINDFLRKMEGSIRYEMNAPSGVKVMVRFPMAEVSYMVSLGEDRER